MFRSAMLHRRRLAIAFAATVLAACSPPPPPEEERRPEPQAQDAQAKSAIVEYADSYKDRARATEAQVKDAAEQQRAQIDAATQ